MSRILLISHKTPPIHGAALIGDAVLVSLSRLHFVEARHISLSVNNGQFNSQFCFLRNIWLLIKLFSKVIYELVFFKPRIVYLTPTLINFGLYRDFILISIVKFFIFFVSRRSRIIIHLHMRPLSGNLKRLIYWFILRRTEVIFLSTDLSNDFNDIKPLFSEIHVLNNFVSSFDKIEVMKRIEERAGRINNSKKFTILYLGHMTKSKGMYRALDVARLLSSRLKEVVFKFYGEFHNDFDHIYFEQYVKKFQLENVVNYNGFCSEEMKCEVFGSADIFILTSHSEAFPLVILEAMSYGLPIVATNTGAVSEILSGYGRLVENSLNSADFSSVFTNQIIASIQNHSKDVLISQVYHVEKNYQLEKFESNLFQILFSN